MCLSACVFVGVMLGACVPLLSFAMTDARAITDAREQAGVGCVSLHAGGGIESGKCVLLSAAMLHCQRPQHCWCMPAFAHSLM